jgi:hypothetical protein
MTYHTVFPTSDPDIAAAFDRFVRANKTITMGVTKVRWLLSVRKKSQQAAS